MLRCWWLVVLRVLLIFWTTFRGGKHAESGFLLKRNWWLIPKFDEQFPSLKNMFAFSEKTTCLENHVILHPFFSGTFAISFKEGKPSLHNSILGIWFQYVPVPSMVPSPFPEFLGHKPSTFTEAQIKKSHKFQQKKQSKTSSYQPPPKGGVFSPQNGVAKNGTPSTPIHFKARRFKGSKGNFPTFNFPTHQPSTSQASTFPNFQVRIWNL